MTPAPITTDVGATPSVTTSRASSLVKIRRAIAIAQPYVLSMPKYDRIFDSRLWRREYGVSDA